MTLLRTRTTIMNPSPRPVHLDQRTDCEARRVHRFVTTSFRLLARLTLMAGQHPIAWAVVAQLAASPVAGTATKGVV